MPFSYAITERDRIVRVAAKRSFTFAEALAFAAAVVRDPSVSPEFNALIDLRGTVLEDNFEEQERFAERLPDVLGSHQRRFALVVDEGFQRSIHELTRRMLEDRGIEIQLFSDAEAAEAWLAQIA